MIIALPNRLASNLILFFLFLICSNAYAYRPIIVGHRGTLKHAPENTLAAFDTAIKMGADMLEIDVRETKDGELVVIHDGSVDRTTNGSGKVSEMTLSEIRKLDAGVHFGRKFKGEQVPTLRETLKFIRNRALPDIDFKEGSVLTLIKVLTEEGYAGGTPLTIHGSADRLFAAKKLPNLFQIRPGLGLLNFGLKKKLKKFDPPVVNINMGLFAKGLVKRIHKKNKKVFMDMMGNFGIMDKEKWMRKALKWKVDYIQTDHLEILVPLVNKMTGTKP